MDEIVAVKVTPNTSKVLQETAFKNGYMWASKGKKVRSLDSMYLIFDRGNKIIRSGFNSTHRTVITLSDAINMLHEDCFKNGDWICIVTDFSGTLVLKLTGKDDQCYSYKTPRGNSVNYDFYKAKRKATDSEIREALITETRRRYNVPQSIRYLDGKRGTLEGFELTYHPAEDRLSASGEDSNVVYEKGQWARKAKKKSSTILGHKVTKLNNRQYKIGCSDNTYTLDELERIRFSLGETSGRSTILDLYNDLSNFLDE